jgi:hypothetical protein
LKYQRYDVAAADHYDEIPKWFRFIVCMVVFTFMFKERHPYKEFKDLERMAREESLKRKINKLILVGVIKND